MEGEDFVGVRRTEREDAEKEADERPFRVLERRAGCSS